MPFEWPEMALRLTYGERANSSVRVAKYLQQMCTSHAEHHRRSSFVKLVHVLDFYLTECEVRNPIGVCSAARVLLELHAHLVHVLHWLLTEAGPSTKPWQERGERFFDHLIRARFATKDPDKQAVCRGQGVPNQLFRPYTVKECLKTVHLRHPGQYPWLDSYYAFLCDFVHSNQGSTTVSTAGARFGKSIPIGKGGMVLRERGTIIRHQYPSEIASSFVISRTVERAEVSAREALEAINLTPTTPFSEDELVRLTGTRHGFGVLREHLRPSRNGLCPCGSGKRYKNCHGSS